VPGQGQQDGTEAGQGKGQNENPAHRPDTPDSRRGCPVRTARQPAGLQDAVP
jgi:hypothetical protein